MFSQNLNIKDKYYVMGILTDTVYVQIFEGCKFQFSQSLSSAKFSSLAELLLLLLLLKLYSTHGQTNNKIITIWFSLFGEKIG